MNRYLSLLIAMLLFVTGSIPPVAANPLDFNCAGVSEIPLKECQALVALYNSTNGPGWKTKTNWLVTNTPSNWHGVGVASGHVYMINLGANQLLGSIPKQVGNLTGLQYLILYSNRLSGTIPPQIGSLSGMKQLFLDGNLLTGSIPIELGNLSNVEQFYLKNNLLTGSIPSQLGNLTKVQGIDLSGNRLSGSIPPQIGNLAFLYYLGLQYNQLSGSIPVELGNLASLSILQLENNQFSGTIPAELGNLGNLTRLFLQQNQLSGSIPAEIGNLAKLQNLYLFENQLSGSIPVELGSMPALRSVVLVDNQLSGPIPPELGNLVNLQQLYLNNNQLNGSIPTALANLASLNNLDLSYNRLDVPSGYPDPANTFHSWLNNKDPDWHQQQAFEQPVGTEGGTVTSLDGKTELNVAGGTLDEGTIFDYIPQPAPSQSVGDLLFAQNSFQVTAKDSGGNPVTTFATPIIISITYDDADVARMNENLLMLFYWNETDLEWQDAATTCPGGEYTRDLEGNSFTVPVCHFSEFAVLNTTRYIYLPVLRR